MKVEWDQENSSGDYSILSRSSPTWKRELGSLLVLTAITVILWFHKLSNISSTLEDSALPDWIIEHAGSGAPYHPAGAYLKPPTGCSVTTVIQLQRHGSRYPTTHASKRIKKALKKLQKVGKSSDETLRFVQDYQYVLKTNDLLPLGAQESLRAGMDFKSRYPTLVPADNLTTTSSYKAPFVRASGSQRVIDSATNFTAGLGWAVGPILVISEEPGINNTLDDHNCPKAPEDDRAEKWLNSFAGPVAKRLNSKAHGLELTPTDVVSLMQLCYFESLATRRTSEFCGVFRNEEWIGYEYYIDLAKLYKHGHGNRLGPVQGVGYVSELLARLTGNRSHVEHDRTQVNHSLDHSSETFPLNRNVYLDFSHDNQMISIITAMGLKRAEPLLKAEGPPDSNREWKISKIVPFGARLVVEKLSCDGDRGKRVRVLMNDELVPMPFCVNNLNQGGCELGSFVESQRFSLKNGDGLYEECGYGSGRSIT